MCPALQPYVPHAATPCAQVQHSPATMRAFVAAAEAARFEVRALTGAAQHPEWRSPEVVILQLRKT